MPVAYLFFNILIFLFILNGCATSPRQHTLTTAYTPIKALQPKGIYYEVEHNDTLWKISQKYNVSLKKLSEYNHISDPAKLKEGDIILIPVNKNYRKGNTIKFSWPVKGKILSGFGNINNNKLNKGVDIQLKHAVAVKAAAGGHVVFCNSIKGYHKTIIIQHPQNFTTVYANLSKIFVKKDQYVNKNYPIGRAGIDTRRGMYILHFEIRKNNCAQNPFKYIND